MGRYMVFEGARPAVAVAVARSGTGREPVSSFVPEGYLHGDRTMSRTGMFTKKLNRRQSLKTVAAAGAACFMPTIIPASALGRGGAVAPSERIVLGGIGLGARGEFDLKWMLHEQDVQFVAICDARKVRRAAIKQIVDKHYGNSDCQMYPRCANSSQPGRTSTRS
jgi:hypothetical protein